MPTIMECINMTHIMPPEFPKIKFDVITCNYVLNVLDEDEARQTITSALSLLKKHGMAFFTVRRNIKKEGFTSKRTFQRNVILDFEIVKQNSDFCIYRKRND